MVLSRVHDLNQSQHDKNLVTSRGNSPGAWTHCCLKPYLQFKCKKIDTVNKVINVKILSYVKIVKMKNKMIILKKKQNEKHDGTIHVYDPNQSLLNKNLVMSHVEID